MTNWQARSFANEQWESVGRMRDWKDNADTMFRWIYQRTFSQWIDL